MGMIESNATYKGEFKNGFKTGKGKLYEGDLENNLRHGNGIEYYSGDSVRYNGDWKNGLYDGAGQYFDENKSYYIGSFKEGKFHGIGQVKHGNNTIVGVWDDNEYVGKDQALVGQIGYNWVK